MSEFIKNFQKKHKLVADGVIGENTLLKMKEVLNIPTLEATAHFVGNTYHETGGYEVFSENLNYSAESLLKIFPKYFKTLDEAEKVARQPEKIANIVYNGRMGNTEPGDGWKFRGRGALQTTGKTNYILLGKYLKVDLKANPDLILTNFILESAVYYFESNKIWNMASTVTDDSIKKVRKAVNGGSIGLEDVNNKIKYFYNILKK